MKKRIMLLIVFGVSFAPPVFAFEPSAPMASARLGENSVLETTPAAVNCIFAEREKSDQQEAATQNVVSISAAAAH